VGAYALLIPRFRIWGALAATLVGFGVILVYGLWEVQRLRTFRFEYQRLFRVMVLTATAIGIYFALNPVNFWLQSGLALALTAAHAIGIVFVCFGRAEREELMQTIRQLRAKYLSKVAQAQVPV
jgi:O-antigen/teichoic acid export membrane protein